MFLMNVCSLFRLNSGVDTSSVLLVVYNCFSSGRYFAISTRDIFYWEAHVIC